MKILITRRGSVKLASGLTITNGDVLEVKNIVWDSYIVEKNGLTFSIDKCYADVVNDENEEEKEIMKEVKKSCGTCGYTTPCDRCNDSDLDNWIKNDPGYPSEMLSGITFNAEYEKKTGTTEEAKHYMTSKQPIELMQELMTPEQFQGFLWGNVIKYAMRLNMKGSTREDAGKCWQYAKWLCEAIEGSKIVPGGK